MALESLTGGSVYINSLVAANPEEGDNLSTWDDHLRGIKNTLLNTFPNVNGAVNATPSQLNRLVGVTSALVELGGAAQTLTKGVGFYPYNLGYVSGSVDITFGQFVFGAAAGSITVSYTRVAGWIKVLALIGHPTDIYSITWPGVLGTNYYTNDLTSYNSILNAGALTTRLNVWILIPTSSSFYWILRAF